MNGTKNEAGEKPLDPEMESLRRRMIRTLAVSIGIMFIGLIAVLVAIVYKLESRPGTDVGATRDAAVPADAPMEARTSLPAGFTVSRVALSGDRILFFGATAAGGEHAFVVDMKTGRVVADLTVDK